MLRCTYIGNFTQKFDCTWLHIFNVTGEAGKRFLPLPVAENHSVSRWKKPVASGRLQIRQNFISTTL
jgi:hypothetical protein